MSLASEFEEEFVGFFDVVFDGGEESDGLFAVDDAVVIGQCDVHHWADDDCGVDDDGAFFDGVHAEDGRLGEGGDGR